MDGTTKYDDCIKGLLLSLKLFGFTLLLLLCLYQSMQNKLVGISDLLCFQYYTRITFVAKADVRSCNEIHYSGIL